MSGFNVLVLKSQDKQAGKEAIVTRTRANKTEKVSPLHIIHVKSVLTLVHGDGNRKRRRQRGGGGGN